MNNFVSVIVPVYNDRERLCSCLNALEKQTYPKDKYEVIVVNDCSEDNSEDVLSAFEKEYERLRVVTIHKEASLGHSKKMALFVGIKAARNEILLLTDADCQPVSDKWISEMTSGFNKETSFVLGYGGYLKEKGILNRYIRFDTMFIAMQYMGMAIAGLPYMGVGRNLAYRKSIFFENKGFGSHMHLQSGDDDLFINALSTGANTKVTANDESFTRSVPASSFAELTKQKIRHLSTAGHYRSLSKFLLGLEPFSRILFYLTAILLLVITPSWPLTLSILISVVLAKLIIVYKSLKSLREKDLLLFSLVFDIVSPFINSYFLFLSRRDRYRSNKWK